ncbi:MAG: serine/threonine protein kinase [Deltaproteobacteria bacterium]|nr:serine/threonine protein kinase [Deltaproteobacteria bacterium]
MTAEAFNPFILGRFNVLALLGSGGMGEVFLAEPRTGEDAGKLYALKRIRPTLSVDENVVKALEREARLAARLRHSNVLVVHGMEADGDERFLVMEYADGCDLGRLLGFLARARKKLPVQLATYVVWSVVRALVHLHGLKDAKGRALMLVHRDVSPSNVVVMRDGVVKLADFGVASRADPMVLATLGQLKGKLSYMAPEVMQQEQSDQRADVFSAGVLLWECLTGKRLFKGKSDMDIITAVLTQDVPAPRQVEPACPEAVSQACLQALSRHAEARFETAAALEKALLPGLAGTNPRALSQALAKLLGQYVKVLTPEEIAALPRPVENVTMAEELDLPEEDTTSSWGLFNESFDRPLASVEDSVRTRMEDVRAEAPPPAPPPPLQDDDAPPEGGSGVELDAFVDPPTRPGPPEEEDSSSVDVEAFVDPPTRPGPGADEPLPEEEAEPLSFTGLTAAPGPDAFPDTTGELPGVQLTNAGMPAVDESVFASGEAASQGSSVELLVGPDEETGTEIPIPSDEALGLAAPAPAATETHVEEPAAPAVIAGGGRVEALEPADEPALLTQAPPPPAPPAPAPAVAPILSPPPSSRRGAPTRGVSRPDAPYTLEVPGQPPAAMNAREVVSFMANAQNPRQFTVALPQSAPRNSADLGALFGLDSLTLFPGLGDPPRHQGQTHTARMGHLLQAYQTQKATGAFSLTSQAGHYAALYIVDGMLHYVCLAGPYPSFLDQAVDWMTLDVPALDGLVRLVLGEGEGIYNALIRAGLSPEDAVYQSYVGFLNQRAQALIYMGSCKFEYRPDVRLPYGMPVPSIPVASVGADAA